MLVQPWPRARYQHCSDEDVSPAKTKTKIPIFCRSRCWSCQDQNQDTNTSQIKTLVLLGPRPRYQHCSQHDVGPAKTKIPIFFTARCWSCQDQNRDKLPPLFRARSWYCQNQDQDTNISHSKMLVQPWPRPRYQPFSNKDNSPARTKTKIPTFCKSRWWSCQDQDQDTRIVHSTMLVLLEPRPSTNILHSTMLVLPRPRPRSEQDVGPAMSKTKIPTMCRARC